MWWPPPETPILSEAPMWWPPPPAGAMSSSMIMENSWSSSRSRPSSSWASALRSASRPVRALGTAGAGLPSTHPTEALLCNLLCL